MTKRRLFSPTPPHPVNSESLLAMLAAIRVAAASPSTAKEAKALI